MPTVTENRTGGGAVEPPIERTYPTNSPIPSEIQLWKRFQSSRTLVLLMLPGLAYFLLFHYGAFIGNAVAFKEYVPFDGLWASPWVASRASIGCSVTRTSGTPPGTPWRSPCSN